MIRIRTLFICLILLLVMGEDFREADAQDGQKSLGLAREHYRQGVFYGKQGKYVEAITELEKAIELYPGYADAYNALGVVYHRQKQNQKAIEQYLLAIEAEPGHVKARTNLAMIYNHQKAYRKAVRQLEKALEVDPTYAPAQKLIGDVRRKADEQDAKELERQQQAAKRTPQPQPKKPSAKKQNSAKPFFAAGTELIKQGKVEAGIREYQKGLKLSPRSAEGYTLLGMAYREKYRTTNDMKWRQQEIWAFNKALKVNPRYVPALLSLGETFYEQGEITKAIPYFKKVLRYAPKHPAKPQLEAIIEQAG